MLRKWSPFFLVTMFGVLMTPVGGDLDLQAQTFNYKAPPRLVLGGSLGRFRISYDDFDKIYDSRWDNAFGGFATYMVSAPYNVVVKYRNFSRTDQFTTTDNRKLALEWDEKWYNVGLRYAVLSRRGFSNYFGFGFTFMKIEEAGEYSVFSQEDLGKERDAGGFFIEFGLHYSLMEYLSLFSELEITSAGLEGKSGFEGNSVGGYYVGVGASLLLF